jgi:probable addiction module antidote protein
VRERLEIFVLYTVIYNPSSNSNVTSRRLRSLRDNADARALGKVRATEEKKMPSRQATCYDAAEFLESDEDIVAYLNAALEDGDPSLVSAALGDIARARGMSKLTKETGITRDALHKAL